MASAAAVGPQTSSAGATVGRSFHSTARTAVFAAGALAFVSGVGTARAEGSSASPQSSPSPFSPLPWRRRRLFTPDEDVAPAAQPPQRVIFPTESELLADGNGSGDRPLTSPSPRQRGKPISENVSAEELYEAYSQIRSEYDEKAFRVGDHGGGGEGWKTIRSTSDGVQISTLSHPSDPSCPYVRMRAVMPGSVEEVWDFLRLENWERTMPSMDPFYEGLTVLGKRVHCNVDMVLARKRTKRILTFGKRDFTFVSVSDVPLSDGSGVWVSGTVSVVTSRFPRQEGYTRAFQDSVAFYEPLPPDPASGEGRTRLTIVCRIDLNDSGEGGDGGAVPMWIYVRTIGVSGLASIQNMRKQLVLDREERRRRKKTREEEKEKAAQRRRLKEEEEIPLPCPLFPWMGN